MDSGILNPYTSDYIHGMKQFLVLCLFLLTSVAFAQKVTTGTKAETSVLLLHERKFHWMIVKQTDSLEQILDERMQYVHSNGWTENKQELLDDIRSGKLQITKVVIKEAAARIYKNFAVVNGKGVFSVVMEGKPMDFLLLYTEVYTKRKNKWLLVSRHANRLMQ
jgi:hypothetical protein